MNPKPKTPKLTTKRLITGFVIAYIACDAFPTPGSWSDVHSQWLPDLVRVPMAFAFCVATHWIYIRPEIEAKFEAVILWFIFGGGFTISVVRLIQSRLFLKADASPFYYLRHLFPFF